MKVIVTELFTDKKREMTLEQALTPHYDSSYGEGHLEALQARSDNLACTVGRLLEVLVNRRTLTLHQAFKISGNRGSIEPKDL
jgi:hypothetical protein